jgi:predicted enzyme related to lactoylglutathione lyase
MGDVERYGLNEIGQIAVTVSDLDRAVKFYREILRLDFLFQVPGMAFFNCSGVRLMLSLPESSDRNHSSSIIYFRVDDIQAMSQAIAIRGMNFKTTPHLVAEMEDHDLWMAFFEDSEGNTMALMSEVRKGIS